VKYPVINIQEIRGLYMVYK